MGQAHDGEKKRSSRQSADAWEKARIKWEADPTMSFADVGNTLCVSKEAVRLHAKKEGWKKVVSSAEIVRRAHDVADSFPAPANADTIGAEKGEAELHTQSVEASVSMRAKILDRHRREWEGARSNVYKAIQNNDFEKAKLGKITAEAIKIIQDGERKAWGFDSELPYNNEPVTIVIERGDD